MEYDRALYRVYERIMEDLNSSPSPLALTSNNAATVSSSPRSGLRRRYNRVDNQDDGGANNSNENDAEIIVMMIWSQIMTMQIMARSVQEAVSNLDGVGDIQEHSRYTS